LRPIGKSSECFRMTAGVKSGKAQNEHMFSGSPESEHRELASMCPLGAVRALRAAALHDGALARTGLAHPICGAVFDYELDRAATANARGVGLRWRRSRGERARRHRRGRAWTCGRLDTAGNSPMHP